MRALVLVCFLVLGCGRTTMRADVGADARDCAGELAAIREAASTVWFVSASDEPIVVSVFPRAGAPSTETILRLTSASASTRVEPRSVDECIARFEPSPERPVRAAPEVLRAAIEASLGELVYVALHDASRDASQATVVRVVLAGRTACDDVVILESVSVEP